MMDYNIGRIALPSRDEFYKKYLSKSNPVIITNLYESQAIRQIKTLDDAKEAFGEMSLDVVRNYTSSSTHENIGLMSLNSYIDYVNSNPDTELLSTEQETPGDILTLFELNPVCLSRESTEPEVFDWPKIWGDNDLMSNVFIANRGNYANLHFDGDHRHVFLTQVFGRKSFCLLPVSSTPRLNPYGLNSRTFIQSMSEAERSEFLEQENGHAGVLEPGDTLYIPALMWHYLFYETHAMSFNVRFGRNSFGRFLSADNFHTDAYVQKVGCSLLDENAISQKGRINFEAIVSFFKKPSIDRLEKGKRIFELMRLMYYDETGEPGENDFNQEDMYKYLETKISRSALYLDFEKLDMSRKRLVGKIDSNQERILDSKIKSSFYGHDGIRKILNNKFGKKDISSLSKAEAAILMRWFNPNLSAQRLNV